MKLVLGCMEFGRRLSVEDSKFLISKILKNGSKELDTAHMYSEGQSETIIGSVKDIIDENEGLVSTKINPLDDSFVVENFREKLKQSLSRLQRKNVDILYLHWPCHKHKIQPLLHELHKLYEEGVFKRLGISNFQSWKVAQICEYCEKHGFVIPSVYQGMYNCLTRDVERELFPCLREYNISFYAYNPLAGGLLTGRHHFEDVYMKSQENKCRFYGVGTSAEQMYRERYWKNLYFEAINEISSSLSNISLLEASFNWLSHNSLLSEANGDAIILGASTIDQYQQNIEALHKSKPLQENVVKIMSECYTRLAGCVPTYYR